LWLDPVGGIQSALDPAGPQAARIERLWWLMFWVTLVVFVLVIGTLSISIARRRRSQPIPFPPKDKLPAEKPIGRVIAAAIALTIITLFVLLVASVVAGKNQHQSLASTNPVSIQVIGHQWWWEVRYTSPQADQTIITANEIHVPVGVPININTSSRDVIHSFWAPNVNGKRDLIPGYSTAFWFQADTARTYRGQCAEFLLSCRGDSATIRTVEATTAQISSGTRHGDKEEGAGGIPVECLRDVPYDPRNHCRLASRSRPDTCRVSTSDRRRHTPEYPGEHRWLDSRSTTHQARCADAAKPTFPG
jgi:heme/copper-type cytochrome/quinol oxidase subunit 2